MKNLWLSDFCQNVINNESPFSGHFKALFMLITMAQSPASYLIHQVFISLLLLPLPSADNGQTKPKPRPKGKTKGKHASPEPEEHLCLLRASNGKKKISTIVSTREVTRFQMVRTLFKVCILEVY